MRKLAFLTSLLILFVAIPLHAARGQSYFTVDDGGTIVRQAEDGRESEGRVNLPVFPGDEVITSRRGRTEIRLSDGNVIALDRSTDVRFRAILDSYEGDASQTVVDLRYGHLAVHRTEYGREYVRIDTDSASYIATAESVYALDSDRGRDQLTVFEGAVEVRTPQRTERVRAGQEARVDEQGLYDLASQSYATADEFERWFLRRAESGGGSSRYLDRSLAYADADLSGNGSWVYVGGSGSWGWRPRVSTGWRPYYNGEWVSGPSGCLVWVSYEPWGWVPYHYGRWAFDSMFGWVWMPGTGYSPAWVYWMYGPSYIGWAPAGWWDCYRPYYNWAYRPYSRASWDNGWYGHVRVREMDFRPWTFVQPNHIVGTRVDRAAVTTEIVRDRLLRGGDAGGLATISNGPARFTRSDLRDPALAVNTIVRRGLGGSGVGGGGTQAGDMTPFIRRDPDLATSVRDRVVRSRPGDGVASVAPIGSGSVTPIGSGSIAPIGGGLVAPIGRGGITPSEGAEGRVRRGDGGTQWPQGGQSGSGAVGDRGVVRRNEGSGGWRDSGSSGGTAPGASPGSGSSGGTIRRDGGSSSDVPRDSGNAGGASSDSGWRGRIQRPSTSPVESTPVQPRTDWRSRGSVGREETGGSPRDRGSSSSSDVSRRVIDRIGGPRVVPGEGSSSPSISREPAPPRVERSVATPRVERSWTPPVRESSPSPRFERSSPSPRIERSSPPPSSPPSSRSEGNRSSGSNSNSGGRVHRDKDQ